MMLYFGSLAKRLDSLGPIVRLGHHVKVYEIYLHVPRLPGTAFHPLELIPYIDDVKE